MKSYIKWRYLGSLLMILSALFLKGAHAQRPNSAVRPARINPVQRGLVSIQELLIPCSKAARANCEISISSPIETNLDGKTSLPPRTVIRFSGQGSWKVRGETLDFNDASIDAPLDEHPNAPILSGSSRLAGLSVAKPEWFASAIDDVYPAYALATAYHAVQPGGTIQLAAHTYLSPFFDPASPGSCGGAAIFVNTSLTLLGSGRPHPDSETAPTRLLDGTVIRGEICGNGILHASHLGVDVGPFAVQHDFAGHPTYGIQFGSTGILGKVRGTSLEDVAVLTTGMKDQHSVIIEGQSSATVRGLWVWTLGGTHGLVMKSSSSTIEDFHCKGASADCLILKSDFATDHAGQASDDRVDGVFISYLARPGDTAGVFLDGSWDSLRRVTMNHIVEDGLSSGISAFDSLLHQVSDINIGDWSATDMTGTCLVLNGTTRVLVERFTCSQRPIDPSPAVLLNGSNTVLRQGTISCSGDTARCSAAAEDGIADRGRDDRVESVHGDNLGGYLVRTSRHRGGTAVSQLETIRMGGRTSAPVIPPSLSPLPLFAGWIALTRQTARIVMTRAVTGRPWLGALGRFTPWLLLCLLLFIPFILKARRDAVRSSS